MITDIKGALLSTVLQSGLIVALNELTVKIRVQDIHVRVFFWNFNIDLYRPKQIKVIHFLIYLLIKFYSANYVITFNSLFSYSVFLCPIYIFILSIYFIFLHFMLCI